MSYNLSNLLYLITIVTFILALRFLSSPAHARRGNQLGAIGMLVAIVVTWVKTGGTSCSAGMGMIRCAAGAGGTGFVAPMATICSTAGTGGIGSRVGRGGT